ncbi:site-specific integrase [Pseudoalteromonas arctica]|uniref:Site-specific integrase n=1 Tax=Pseudoalteromonas arctica TaxID=394751 RepID=A0AAP6Y4E4_9GAMM|nr:tyrosine-type recombinase/integrase [Pseudoalteromonas arctica]NMP04842.1 site-specific integrase [Pseudoalteromonas arctica]
MNTDLAAELTRCINSMPHINIRDSIKQYIKDYEALVTTLKNCETSKILDNIRISKVRLTDYYTTVELSAFKCELNKKASNCSNNHIKKLAKKIIKILDVKIDRTLRFYELAYKNLPPVVTISRLRLLALIKKMEEDRDYIPPLNRRNRLDINKIKVSKHVSGYEETKLLIKKVNTKITKRTNIAQVVLDKENYKILGNKQLNTIEDLVSPADYVDDYIQLKQLIARINLTEANPITSTYKYMCEFLKCKNIPKKSNILDIFTDYTLLIFTDWLSNNYVETGIIKPSTTKRIILGANKVVELLKTISPMNFKYVHFAQHITPTHLTTFTRNKVEQYNPYTLSERKSVFFAIDKEIEWAEKFREPYTPTKQKKSNLSDSKLISVQRILDLNILKLTHSLSFVYCDRQHPDAIYLPRYGSWYRLLWNEMKLLRDDKHIHTLDTLDLLYIKTYRNINKLILPYLLKIAKITGLNTEAISSLKIDSLIAKDAISGKPALYYFKARSGGEKTLHLPLFHYAIQHVSPNTYFELKKCFDAVIDITKEIRHIANKKDSEYLFIFHFLQKKSKVIGFSELRKTTSLTRSLLKNFIKKYNLKSEATGKDLVITTGRFRPTLVSELIRNNTCIRTISHILGHASIKVTYQYLEANDFELAAKQKVYDAQIKIHNQSLVNLDNLIDAEDENSETKAIVTPMLTSSCKDIMNPPTWIKESDFYVEGEPCVQFNQCLACENVLITVESLPHLFARKRDLLTIFESSDLKETPYKIFLNRHIKTLDSILEEKQSNFTREELKKAEQESVFITSKSDDPFGM